MNTLTTVSEIFNEDCMIGMARYPDKYFDLAVVDPPYGLNIVKNGTLNTSSNTKNIYQPKNWDEKIPDDEYFEQLFRVSKNQIVWGGNYFPYLWQKGCKAFICWNKLNHHDNRADIEMAWTSFGTLAKYVEYMWDGNRYGTKGNIQGVGKPSIRIHPIEKPVYLYDWILKEYTMAGQSILDTHLGSGSSRIAADKAGNIDFYGWEIDKDYFLASDKRFQDYKKQLRMF